jgi:glycosyltransferase involved in cell wall biosynthesis
MPRKIHLLLTPRIGSLKMNQLAGTEKVFLEDIHFLKTRYPQLEAYARFSLPEANIQRIYFPFLLIKVGEFFRQRNILLCTSALFFIADSVYLFQFLFKSRGADLLMSYSFPLLALFSPEKSYIFMHAHLSLPSKKLFKKRYERAHFIFCSRALKNSFLVGNELTDSKNYTVLYNAVDLSLFHPLQKKVSARKNKVSFFFCSAWVKEKGLDKVLEAFSSLPTSLKNKFTLTIASPSDLWYFDFPEHNQAYLQKIQILLSQMKNIRLLHGVESSKMPELYRQHDYVLFPSLWEEPFGLIVLESLACGTPVITFNSGAIKEIVSKDNSIIVKQKTSEALQKVIAELLKKKVIPKKKGSLLTKKNEVMISSIREKKFISLLENGRNKC